MPFQRIPKVGPVIVAGGVIDTVTNPVVASQVTGDVAGNVGGTVGGVLGNVSVSPLSVVAQVTDAVPFPYKSGFFWPAISGEQFPPTFGSGASYGLSGNLSAYAGTSNTAATVTFPKMSRVSVLGKKNITLAFLLRFAAAGSPINTVLFGYGPGTPGTAASSGVAGVSLATTNLTGALVLTASDGAGGVDTTGASPALNDQAWHTVEIDISAAGVCTLKVDGATIGSTGARVPSTLALTNNALLFNLFTSVAVTQLAIGWS